MKKLLAILLALGVGFVLGVTWKDVTALAGSGGSLPVGNGDVNGDGAINLTDAVYTLTWLFLGGPAPEPIECLPATAKGLPATGQTKCYGIVDGQGWTEVPCAEAADSGQDGAYQAGCPMEGRFIDHGDGTVTDTCTGLMWQRDTADVNGDGMIDPSKPGTDRLNWQGALKYCDSLSFAGHDDWRLPNVRELESIVDYGRWNPSIHPVFEALSDWYWSSTSFADRLLRCAPQCKNRCKIICMEGVEGCSVPARPYRNAEQNSWQTAS